jgi:hypothetical protein
MGPLVVPTIPEVDQLALLRQDFAVSQGNSLYEGMVSMIRKKKPPTPTNQHQGWWNEPLLMQWKAQQTLLKKYSCG